MPSEDRGASEFHQVWERLNTWLELHAPDDYRALRLPASDAAINSVTDGAFPLCDELRALLQHHDGVPLLRSAGDPGSFLPGTRGLYGTQRLRAGHQRMRENVSWSIEEGTDSLVVGETAHTHWIPFAGDVTGQELVIDHRPGATYGKVLEYDDEYCRYEPRWRSLTHFFGEVADALETMSRIDHYQPQMREDSLSVEWRVG